LTESTKNPLAGGLLSVALILADVRDKRRVVEQAAFRRAISSAYYALHHTLCHVCGDALGLWTPGGDDLALIYRNVDHARSADVLRKEDTKSLHPDLVRISDVFIELRKLREDSDYSQPGLFGKQKRLLTRSETRSIIGIAEEAVRLTEGLPRDVRRRLAILLTVGQNRRRTGQGS
jgi:hypothetical protein